MSYSVIITLQAQNDLRELASYILKESGSADIALKLIDEIENCIDNLKDFPQSGAYPKDRVLLSLNYRYLIHDNYLIFYRIIEENKTVCIDAIFNAKQDYFKVMKKFI
jgi:toxin ParE1/3/4